MGGWFTFQHVLAQDEVLPPDIDDVVGQGTARRAVVVEARDAAVDVERGRVEHAALQTVSV